ncbi:outer membrane protein [Paraburkholderia caballeronis]|nr:outer membrane protein [Paraburkholderia caballeronis]
MKKKPLFVRPIFMTVVASTVFSSGVAWGDEGADAENPGLTILSNATNVTHWGLGAGVGVKESPYQGYGTKVQPFPLVYFDNKWVRLLGTTVDVKIGSWDGVSIALRGKYSLGDGYSGSDAPILNGMQDRNGAFWYGPALAWRTAFGTLSADYLVSGNKGQQASIDYSKSFDFGNFSLTPHVGADWFSSKYVDYYYGVPSYDARPGRQAYSGTASWNTSLGTRIGYRLTQHQRVQLDVGVTRLGGGITDSPLVGKRFTPEVRIGYNYQFK